MGITVEDLVILALGDHGADTGFCIEAGNASAARTHPLGQRPLRVELKLHLAAQVLPHELGILADIRRNHLPDLPRLQ
ncbi:hypothetical protein X751_29670 [Mesorhizobium sp. LNJC395A00]|nr:hypothetical protein X751_29670 [Mesorhizobium sp. LNJC395A00]